MGLTGLAGLVSTRTPSYGCQVRADYWQVPQFLSTWPLYRAAWMSSQHATGFLQNKWSKSKAELQCPLWLSLRSHLLLLPPYLIGNTYSHYSVWDSTTEGYENQEVESIGGHLESENSTVLCYEYFCLYPISPRGKFIFELCFSSFYLLHTIDTKFMLNERTNKLKNDIRKLRRTS